ncbi:MAG: type IV toxin-antitoxin system AbiEi family antitoxin [Desulfosalsimonadaceae bacterium]
MKTHKNINHRVTGAMEILDAAKRAFAETTGCNIQALEAAPAGEKQPDAVLRIDTPEGATKAYYAEIKGNVIKATLGYVAEQLRRFEKPGILITRHVTPPMAERLRALNLAFIDTAGNAYINDPPLFIYIAGRKKKDIPEKNIIGRAFRPTGLKVVFALLCQPELVNAPYRDIVQVTHVAQGTVGWVMADLKQQNYLTDRGEYGRKLINVGKLLDVWVETYARELRPRLFIGKYDTKKIDWWKTVDWRQTNACLGAEPAAALLTDYIKPATITIYGPEEINPFLLTHRLKKDPTGNVELFKKFWEFDYPWDYEGIAPPLLVYADLIATGNDRNAEAARIIYDKFIHRFIEKL